MLRLLGMKIVLLPTILFIFIISIIFTIRGIWISSFVVISLLTGEMQFQLYTITGKEEPPSLILLEAVDSFLLSFVFFIFSFGLYKIFFFPDLDYSESKIPRWLRLESIFELKALLWQSVLTTLVVLFLNYSVVNVSHKNFSWEFAAFPVSIMVIAIALYFLKLAEKGEKSH